jgi:hypothetical protein
MTERLLLVDFENVQDVDLTKLPDDVRIRLVLGAKISRLPMELAVQAQSMGDRFAYVPIKGQAPDAVDFCIAFYLGEYLAKNPTAECVILSKDKKGFDPLVKHLTTERKFKVRRVNSQKEAFAHKAPVAVQTKEPPSDDFGRAVALLGKESSFPKKRSGLEGKVKSYFTDMSPADRTALVDRLFREGRVSEDGGKLSFKK